MLMAKSFTDAQRFDTIMAQAIGKRLTYEQLIGAGASLS
jgi:hypothetical protein